VIAMSDVPEHSVTSHPERERYLVGGATPDLLSTLIETLKADSQIDLLQVKGPADRPSILVIETTADRAEQLKQQYHGLIVEPDAPLKY
jgi:hypothetical protein